MNYVKKIFCLKVSVLHEFHDFQLISQECLSKRLDALYEALNWSQEDVEEIFQPGLQSKDPKSDQQSLPAQINKVRNSPTAECLTHVEKTETHNILSSTNSSLWFKDSPNEASVNILSGHFLEIL